jgi:TRAP-type C4-dicarboxylate transport system permease small subunit
MDDQQNPPSRPSARIERALAAGCMALLCLITFANVLVRYLTNVSFAFTEEFSVFLLLALTLLGSAGAFADGRHIRITLLVDKLSANGRKLCSALEWLANVAMFGLLAWLGYGMAYDDFEFEVTSPGLGLPQWWYSAWLPLLSALIVLRLLLLLWRRRGGRS